VPRVSVIVLTLNEERNIARCLGSVRWADEVVVVDSFSADRTVEIARAHGAAVIAHEYDTDLRQRSRGFGAATGEWILVLDADEEISPGLAAEIRQAVGAADGDDDPDGPDGYEVPILMNFRGRWIRHGGWYPGYTLRLFRRDKVRTEDAAVHGGYAVPGARGRFRHPIHHYSYDSISHYLGKMNDYTSLQVANLLRSRPGYSPGPAKLVFSPVSHFVRNYLTRRGYRDGAEGFLLAALDSIYALALYAKLWEYRTFAGGGEPPPVDMAAIRAMKRRYAR
jgi:glycosyltransferase involved in cell wall biosynthesis